jgi:hypothetical protein
MLGRLTAQGHLVVVLVEPLLNLLQHSLVLPTRDAPLGTGRAPSLERALRWRCRDRLMRRSALLGHIVATDVCLLNLSSSKA